MMHKQDSRRLHVVVLVLIALAVAALRWHTYGEPRDRDLDIYAWVGHYLFQGHALYADLVDLKPPLPYLLFALAERMVGIGDAQAYLLGLLSALATIAGLYRLGANGLGKPWMGLAAAAFWALLGSDLYLEANQPNTEAFINAFFVWALALLWRPSPPLPGRVACIASGLLFGAATLCKTVALVPALLVIPGLVLVAGPDSRRQAVERMVVVVSGITVAWLLTLAWLASQGALGAAWQILFIYPSEYATQHGGGIASNIIRAFETRHLLPSGITAIIGLVYAAAAGLALAARGRCRTTAVPMLLWMAGTFVAIAMPGNFYPHYYQLWLPWLALALAVLLDALTRHWPRRTFDPATAVFVVFAFAWFIARVLPQWQLDARDWSVRKYGGQFVDAQQLGRDLGVQLAPNQRLFVFGVFPDIYVQAGRQPPPGAINVWFALPHYGFHLSQSVSPRVLSDLRASPPDMVVLDAETWSLAGRGEPLREWIAANYRISANRHGFALAVRADE